MIYMQELGNTIITPPKTWSTSMSSTYCPPFVYVQGPQLPSGDIEKHTTKLPFWEARRERPNVYLTVRKPVKRIESLYKHLCNNEETIISFREFLESEDIDEWFRLPMNAGIDFEITGLLRMERLKEDCFKHSVPWIPITVKENQSRPREIKWTDELFSLAREVYAEDFRLTQGLY